MIFDLSTRPDYIVLYQKNIEAVCSTEGEVREQIKRTIVKPPNTTAARPDPKNGF